MAGKQTTEPPATPTAAPDAAPDHPLRAEVLEWLGEKKSRGYRAAARKFKLNVEVVREWGRAEKKATRSRKGKPAPKITDDLDRLEEAMVAVLARRAHEEKHVGAAKAALLGIESLRSTRTHARDLAREKRRARVKGGDWTTMDRGDYLKRALVETHQDIVALRAGSQPSGQAIAALRRQAQLLRQDLDAVERSKAESEDLSTEDMVAGILAMPFEVLEDPRLVAWYREYLATGDPWAAHRTTYAVAE